MHTTLKKILLNINNSNYFMSLESIFMVVAPICLFTVGVIVILFWFNHESNLVSQRYIRGL